ncbi:MAG TPA: phage tail protein I [Streptosporangiaceae bacterium]|nr:phage tail protein I [Streptosporangiaceae bacterium]HEX5290845.1 phage tail protein I [Streptosporangiaceae bacterium]
MAAVPIASAAGRRFAPILGAQWWNRCSHHGTVVDAGTAEVTLSGQPVASGGAWPEPPGPPAERAGIAFDQRGWLYHGICERGQIERLPWPRAAAAAGNVPVDLLADPVTPEPPLGSAAGFSAIGADPGRPLRARAMAADPDDHLFVLDGATGTIAVLDLADGRLLRTIALAWPPVDLAARGPVIVVATSARDHPLVEIDAIGEPRAVPAAAGTGGPLADLPPAAGPHRVAVGPGGDVWLMVRDDTAAWVVRMTGERLDQPLSVPGADDIGISGSGDIVIAGPAGHDLLVWAAREHGLQSGTPLAARGYDGRGIAITPDGRAGFWTARGFRLARPLRVRYPAPAGWVDTYRLDSQAYRQRWGRLFLEACLPPGTKVEAGFATADELPRPEEMLDAGPGGDPPALEFASASSDSLLNDVHPLHRRETGRELPWTPLDRGDRFEVYEAPVRAGPGRYLWLRLRLTGTGTLTPRIRAVRVECDGHDLLQRLPRTYRDDAVAAAFLWRYLAMIDGVLSEMDWRARQRDLLFDPRGAPAEVLPWLASLIGLTLDQRWPEPARRAVLAEAICLFRRRGTVPGLKRMLEMYLQSPVAIIETFQLRGRGGAFVGGAEGAPDGSSAVVGTSLRVGGGVSLDTGLQAARPPDAFATHAHRFSVLISGDLDPGQLAVVRDLLDLNRPAHTAVDICAGPGMRVGVGLYLAVSTTVGPGSAFAPAVVGRSSVGGGTVTGRGRAGVRVGATRLAGNTAVDP